MTSTLSLTLRTWLRYVVPLTLLSAITLVAIVWIGVHARVPADAVSARATVRLGWFLVGGAGLLQLLLVAAVAPVVRSVARGAPLSQWRALAGGVRSLVRGVVPWAVAIAAIAIGGLALVVPGFVLLVLLAMTGASDELGAQLPAPLTDSVATARAHLFQIAVVVAAAIALDVAVGLVAQLLVVHSPPKPAVLQARTFVRIVAVALVAMSALPACALAATYHRAKLTP